MEGGWLRSDLQTIWLSQGAWEGFVVEGLLRSWEMALRGLHPKMIENIHDIVEKKFSNMSTRLDASLADQGKKVIAKFEASLADRVKDEVRKEFYSYLWSWILPI